MLANADGRLQPGGEWDSPLGLSSITVNGWKQVSSGGEQCVGAGAEPLVYHRLLLAGHHGVTRPSGISMILQMKEEMFEELIAGDEVEMMIRKEEFRLPPITEG